MCSIILRIERKQRLLAILLMVRIGLIGSHYWSKGLAKHGSLLSRSRRQYIVHTKEKTSTREVLKQLSPLALVQRFIVVAVHDQDVYVPSKQWLPFYTSQNL